MIDGSTLFIYEWETEQETRLRFTREVLREMTTFRSLFGNYPEEFQFRGKLGKVLFDIMEKYNLNFGVKTSWKDHYDNELMMKHNKEITIEADKAHDMGFIYTKETKIKLMNESTDFMMTVNTLINQIGEELKERKERLEKNLSST